MFSIFSRSALYANLTPGERALLRFLSTLLYGAAIAGGQAVLPLLSSPTLDLASVPWASVGHTFLAAAALAFALGIGKYHSAQGDPPLPPQTSAPTPVLPPLPAPVPAPPFAQPLAAAAAAAAAVGAAAGDGADAAATSAGVPAMAFPPDAAPQG